MIERLFVYQFQHLIKITVKGTVGSFNASGIAQRYMRRTEMESIEILDKNIRHFIYKVFAKTTKPPTTEEVSKFCNVKISQVEECYIRLANARQIALAPGSFSIWMAHPFSSIPTNFTVDIGPAKYFAN